MNKKIKEFQRESGIEIYGLGRDRLKWELSLEKYTELVVKECARVAGSGWADPGYQIKQHFEVE